VRRLFDEADFIVGQTVEFVHELVDLAVRGVELPVGGVRVDHQWRRLAVPRYGVAHRRYLSPLGAGGAGATSSEVPGLAAAESGGGGSAGASVEPGTKRLPYGTEPLIYLPPPGPVFPVTIFVLCSSMLTPLFDKSPVSPKHIMKAIPPARQSVAQNTQPRPFLSRLRAFSQDPSNAWNAELVFNTPSHATRVIEPMRRDHPRAKNQNPRELRLSTTFSKKSKLPPKNALDTVMTSLASAAA